MSDIVVTIPKDLWLDWIEEGDLPGEPWGGDYWSYYTGGAIPSRIVTTGDRWSSNELVRSQLANDDREWHLAAPDQRCYVVAHGRLRGFAPLFAVETDETGRELKAFIRRGDAVAITIPEPIRGFQGWRYRWWERDAEISFQDWRTP